MTDLNRQDLARAGS